MYVLPTFLHAYIFRTHTHEYMCFSLLNIHCLGPYHELQLFGKVEKFVEGVGRYGSLSCLRNIVSLYPNGAISTGERL